MTPTTVFLSKLGLSNPKERRNKQLVKLTYMMLKIIMV